MRLTRTNLLSGLMHLCKPAGSAEVGFGLFAEGPAGMGSYRSVLVDVIPSPYPKLGKDSKLATMQGWYTETGLAKGRYHAIKDR